MIGRRRDTKARVQIVDVPESAAKPDGAVTTKQAARVTLPRSELDRIWAPEYLERLARTYWRFLTRVSLGILRVRYTPHSREVVVFGPPLVLLTFHAPEYRTGPDFGMVTWRIRRGLLVAPAGRGKGFLRITVERPARGGGEDGDGMVTGTVTSEVANFYPTIAGWGAFARFGAHLYRITQLNIHVVVTHAFLRSLARLDLAPSRIGSLLGEQVAGSREAVEESERV